MIQVRYEGTWWLKKDRHVLDVNGEPIEGPYK